MDASPYRKSECEKLASYLEGSIVYKMKHNYCSFFPPKTGGFHNCSIIAPETYDTKYHIINFFCF